MQTLLLLPGQLPYIRTVDLEHGHPVRAFAEQLMTTKVKITSLRRDALIVTPELLGAGTCHNELATRIVQAERHSTGTIHGPALVIGFDNVDYCNYPARIIDQYNLYVRPESDSPCERCQTLAATTQQP